MKKVLFVDCCIRREASRSKELAEYFIQKLEETGAYEIERLCLMDENLSYFPMDSFFREKPFWRRENSTILVSAMRTSLRRRIKS